jgi:hypothetical protein
MHLLGIAGIRAVAGNGDETLGLTPDRRSLCLGGLDPLMRKELLDKVSTQSQSGAGRPSKSVT